MPIKIDAAGLVQVNTITAGASERHTKSTDG